MESYVLAREELHYIEKTIGKERTKELGITKEGMRLYRGRGCKLCSGTGYEGRIGVYEIIEINEEIRRLIMQRANSEEIRKAAIRAGAQTMLDDGIKKALRGVTTIEEVLRATHE